MFIQTSDAFNKAILQDGRTFRAKLSCGDEIIDSGFTSIKIYGGSNSTDVLTIGSTISQRIEVEMNEPDVVLSDKEWMLEIGILIDDITEQYEYIPIGYFTVEKPLTKSGKTTFTAYDRMIKLSGIYYCLLEEVNTLSVLNEISIQTGVPFDLTGLEQLPMKKPEGFTYRETLMYIAQMYGKFANVGRYGMIEFHWWMEVANYEVTPDNTNGFKHDEEEYVLGYVSVASKDDEGNTLLISVGEGKQGISIQNPFMTETAVNNVYASIANFSYTVSSLECPLGDIRLDPWDVISVVDTKGNVYRVPLMMLDFKYDGGISANISCVGQTQSESNSDYKGPMKLLQEQMETQIKNLQGVVSVIKQNAGQVSVINSDEKGKLTTVIDTKNWTAEYVDAKGNKISGLYFDFQKSQFVFNGAGHFTGSIDVASKFIVDANGNARIYGGRYYAMDEDGNLSGFTSMDKDGFTVYSKDAIQVIKIGFPDGYTSYPYVLLSSGTNTDEQSGIVKKFANGLWMGNDAPAKAYGEFVPRAGYNGFFISFVDGKTYVVNGTDMQNVYTGESIARFG